MPLGAYLWTRETLLLNLCEMCSHDCLSMFQMSVLCEVSLLTPLSKQQTWTNAKHGFCSSSMAACDCIRPYGLWTPGVHLELIHYDTQWLYYRGRTCSKCPRCFRRVHSWLQVGDYIWRKFVTAITLLVTAYLKFHVKRTKRWERFLWQRGVCSFTLVLETADGFSSYDVLMVVTLLHCVSWLCSFQIRAVSELVWFIAWSYLLPGT